MKKALMVLALLAASSFAGVQGWTPAGAVKGMYTVQGCTDNNTYTVITTQDNQTIATGSNKKDYQTIVEAARNSLRTGRPVRFYLAWDPANAIVRRISYTFLHEGGNCSGTQLVDMPVGVAE